MIKSQTIERVVNLTGKYVIPGLFDMHAHVAGVLEISYDHITSENTLGCCWIMESQRLEIQGALLMIGTLKEDVSKGL